MILMDNLISIEEGYYKMKIVLMGLIGCIN